MSTLFFSSRQLIVTGNVAELEAVPKAVTRAFPILSINLKYVSIMIATKIDIEFLLT